LAKIAIDDAAAEITPAYFDSPLIAKFYLNETGRQAIRELAKRAGVVMTSGIAVAEVSAAFHRKLREGSIDRTVFNALNEQFHHDLNEGLWRLISPTAGLFEEVRELVLRLDPSIFLRSLDAIHLASAKSEHFERIYSNDRHLLQACPKVGIQGINPISESPGLPRTTQKTRSISKKPPRD
jgi:predicted nucleic acid-binding protein